MKLLVVTSFFPTSAKDNVPQFLLEQIHALAKYRDDIEIFVLSTTRNTGEDIDLPDNVRINRFSYFIPRSKQNLTNLGILPAIKDNPLNFLQIPFLFLFEMIALFRVVRKYKPDYIYSHWFLPQGILCHLASKTFNIPHLFTSHSYDVEICKKVPFIGPFIVKRAIRNMKAITVVSQRTLGGISQFFDPEEWNKIKHKCKVMPMGINLPNLTSTDSYKLTDTDTELDEHFVILFMGRFVDKKGIEVLLEAFYKLHQNHPKAILVLAGDGIIKSKITNLIKQLNIESHVILPGFINTQTKKHYLKKANLFVLPSIDSPTGDREGLPVSLLESLSYGKICIATKASGAGEVINDGKNGYLIKSNDVESLYESLEKCIKQNSEEIKIMEDAALSTAEQYSWDNIIKLQYSHFFK